MHHFWRVVQAKQVGNIGIEITKKAYYNIYNKTISTDEAVDFLIKNISVYSSMVNFGKHNEVISEGLAKNNSREDDCTIEFIRLLKVGG